MNFHLKLFSKSACLCSILFTTGAIEPARAAAPDDPIGAALKHGWDQFTNFLGINNVPTANAIRPTVIPPKGGTKMDSTKFYRVDIRCSVNVDTSKLVNRGVTLNDETFVSHSLWFSSSGSNGNVPPSTAKLVNVFSFLKGCRPEFGWNWVWRVLR
jgi:hypothetical protein